MERTINRAIENSLFQAIFDANQNTERLLTQLHPCYREQVLAAYREFRIAVYNAASERESQA